MKLPELRTMWASDREETNYVPFIFLVFLIVISQRACTRARPLHTREAKTAGALIDTETMQINARLYLNTKMCESRSLVLLFHKRRWRKKNGAT